MLFSIGNSLFTIIGYWNSLDRGRRNGRELQSDYYARLVRIHAGVCTVVWLLSAQFHARDTLVSERLDYFGAGAMLFFTLYLTLHRNFPRYSTLSASAVLISYW